VSLPFHWLVIVSIFGRLNLEILMFPFSIQKVLLVDFDVNLDNGLIRPMNGPNETVSASYWPIATNHINFFGTFVTKNAIF
jgi:hypothetical protein